MTEKLPEVDKDGVLTKQAMQDIILAISCSPETTRGDISIYDWVYAIVGAQHVVDQAHEAEAVRARGHCKACGAELNEEVLENA